MAETPLTGFLFKSEKDQLQTLYEEWINKLTPTTFMPKLIRSKLISVYDQQSINAEPVKYKKSMKIFNEVLMHSTYEDLSTIRELLVETASKGHIELAKGFPRRGENINFEPPAFDKYSDQCSDSHTRSPDEFVIGMAPNENEATGFGEQPMDDDYSLGAGGCTDKYKPKKKEHVNRIERYYSFKSQTPSRTGKGLCVVIRNFSDDLKGYGEDVKIIRRFFGDTLDYEVLEGNSSEYRLVDLTYGEFELALDKVVKKLNRQDSPYDRFFLFVLSHGNEKGLEMIKRKGEPDRYKVADIISKFTHDKIFQMKDYPKCFFIQACRGPEVAQAAGNPDSEPSTQKPVRYFSSPAPLAVGGNVLVCYPTMEKCASWVPGTGSWFIQHMIPVFEKYYRTEHLMDMMIETAFHVSGTTTRGVQDKVVQESVWQMPSYVCSLTHKFYLYYPPEH